MADENVALVSQQEITFEKYDDLFKISPFPDFKCVKVCKLRSSTEAGNAIGKKSHEL